MPYAPPKVCARRGCGRLTHKRFCDQHEREHHREEDARRGSANQRLYDYWWQKNSKAFLRLPENALCKIIGRHGEGEPCNRPAGTVDHIIPHRGNKALFRDVTNWQAACHDCNSWKSGRILPPPSSWGVRPPDTRGGG